jgi:hypothetical protein
MWEIEHIRLGSFCFDEGEADLLVAGKYANLVAGVLARSDVIRAPSAYDSWSGSIVIDESPGQVPFQAHVELLQLFLAERKEIVERLQGVLNAQRKPVQYLQDRPLLSRHIEDCFFILPAVTDTQSRLKGQLEKAHWASGFRPCQVPELHNDLIDPAEMMIRGFHCWRQTRWPGVQGRVRYAHTLFNLLVIRCLQLLSLRLWDAGASAASDRLAQAQAVLDELWENTPAELPALVRDARWLIPLAQSPTTDELAAYFEVAEQVAESLTDGDRIEIPKAHIQMIGGHLRSQIRHYCVKDGVPLNDSSVVLRTRSSNALDFALLIQSLVPLLTAYEQAQHRGDGNNRLELASAICQAISPDPDLFLNRVDLLGPYSMIEHLFVTTDSHGQVTYTRMGRRHLQLLQEYEERISRLLKPLYDDCTHSRPVTGAYSPYGAIYGTPTNLIEDMALKTLQLDAVTQFSLEDVFTDGDTDKLAWINGWRKLPHVNREVQELYEYPQQFAEDIFNRIEHALHECVSNGDANEGVHTGRLFILSEDEQKADPKASLIPDLPVRYVGSSDVQIVAAQQADSYDPTRLLRHRQEGYFALSYETSGGWVAIKKDFLTEVLGVGRDVKIVGLPSEATEVLRLMCPNLVAPNNDSAGSV